jgi:hypothetical protein
MNTAESADMLTLRSGKEKPIDLPLGMLGFERFKQYVLLTEQPGTVFLLQSWMIGSALLLFFEVAKPEPDIKDDVGFRSCRMRVPSALSLVAKSATATAPSW